MVCVRLRPFRRHRRIYISKITHFFEGIHNRAEYTVQNGLLMRERERDVKGGARVKEYAVINPHVR